MMSNMAMKYEDWLRGCVHHDGRKGNVYLPCDMVLAIADWIEAHRDVAPVRHGKYIGTEFDGYADGCPVYYEWKCSECGCVFEEEEPTYNYCPNCGAKMDEEDEWE